MVVRLWSGGEDVRSCSGEVVCQVECEAEQGECAVVDFETLCHLVPTCIRDMRTVFLVNDQLLPNVVHEELTTLTHRI